MKKYFLFIIICISSFMIYTNNVKAEEYYSFGFGTATCSGDFCNNFDNGNNIITIPNNSGSNSISRGETNLNYSNAIDMSSYSGFLVQIDVSYFDNMPTAYNESYTDSWICTNSINESGSITYADGTSARVALGAECTEWGSNSTHSTTTQNGTLATSSYTSLLYWFSASGSVNSCFLQTADNNHLTYNCPITANASNKYVKYLKLVSYYRSDSDIKIELARYGMLAYKSDTDKLNQIITALQNSNSTQQQISNNTNEIKNDIKSDNTSGAETSADDLKNNSAFQDNSGLSGVISMPLTFVNSLTNTCQPINLTIPYIDVDLSIPCLQPLISDKVPLLANLIKIVVNGFIVYRVLLDIFQIIRNAKNPEDDRIEVLDL